MCRSLKGAPDDLLLFRAGLVGAAVMTSSVKAGAKVSEVRARSDKP